MEYIYGTDGLKENLKTIGSEHTDLAGRLETKQEYDDCVITDTCIIVDHYKSDKDKEGKSYDWYHISDHVKSVDFSKKFEPRVSAAEDALSVVLELLPTLGGEKNA
jgi:hypothetical protein